MHIFVYAQMKYGAVARMARRQTANLYYVGSNPIRSSKTQIMHYKTHFLVDTCVLIMLP